MRALAEDAATRAYAPYSNFRVGAAVLCESGAIFAAPNVENASYSLTICAERNAIFQAVSNGCTRIRAVVVFTPTDRPCPPCGACRQVISEFGPNAEVFSFSATGDCLHANVRDLLPHAFGPGDLGK